MTIQSLNNWSPKDWDRYIQMSNSANVPVVKDISTTLDTRQKIKVCSPILVKKKKKKN